jgi:hypothetical protein
MATVSTAPRTTTITLATATAGPFDVGFRVFDADRLSVFVNGVPHEGWAFVDEAFADGYMDDAQIEFNDDLESGDVILIDADLTPIRAADYVNGDPRMVEKLNTELGRLWSSVADVRRDAKRSLRAVDEVDRPVEMVTDAVPIWNGTHWESGPSAGEIAAAQEYAESAALSAAQSALYGGDLWLDTVAAVFADIALTYEEGAGEVAVGQFVRTRSDQVSYRVLAEGSTEWSVQTAGGVKLRPVPNSSGQYTAPQIGCIGDGIEDDTDAIEDAVTWLLANEGGTLFFPSGTYLLSRKITIDGPVWLEGSFVHFMNDYTEDPVLLGSWITAAEGTDDDLIYFTGDPDVFEDGEYPRVHAGMRNIGVNGNRSANPVPSVISGTYPSYVYTPNADLNSVGSGIVLDGVSYVSLEGVKVFRCAEHGVKAQTRDYGGTIGAKTTNNLYMNDVTSIGNGIDGFNMFGGDSKLTALVGGYNGRDGYNGGMGPVSASRFWNNQRFGAIGQGFGVQVSGCEIYDNQLSGVLLQSGEGHIVTSNKIYDNGRDGDATGNGRAGIAISSSCGHVVVNGNSLFVQNEAYRIAFYDTLVGGTGYTNGSYTNRPLTGGTGTGATADITVAGGVVTAVVLVERGGGYTVGDTLTASGLGAGSGFSITVSVVSYPFTGDMLTGISATTGTPTGSISGNSFDGVTPYDIDDPSQLFWEDQNIGSAEALVAVQDEVAADTFARVGALTWKKDGGADIADLPDFSPDGVATFEHYLAVGDGVTNDTAALLAALQAGHSVVRGREGATYLVDYVDALVAADITLDLTGITIKGSDSTDLIGGPGSARIVDSPVIRLRCDTADRFRVRVTGTGTIDASQRTYLPGVASGSGMLIRYAEEMLADGGVRFYGGDSREGDFADSGLVPEYCNVMIIDGCFFKGWKDHPIYATGGPNGVTASMSKQLTVTNCQFEENAGNIRLARGIENIVISGNHSKDCGKFVVGSGGATNAFSYRSLLVTGNHGDGFDDAAIDLRQVTDDCATVITNNVFYDWGSRTDATSAWPCVSLRGVPNALVQGNVMMPRRSVIGDTDFVCHIGVYLTDTYGSAFTDHDDTATLYECKNCVVTGNTIMVFERPVDGATDASYGILDGSNNFTNIIDFNLLLNAADHQIKVLDSSTDVTLESPQVIRRTATGLGLGGIDPVEVLHVNGTVRVSRTPDIPEAQFMSLFTEAGGAVVRSNSAANNAKLMNFQANTNQGYTAVTSGELGFRWMLNNVEAMKVHGTGQVTVGANITPVAKMEIEDTFGVMRGDTDARRVEIDLTSTLAIIRGMSPSTSGRVLAINATTDSSNTAPSGGTIGLYLQTLGITRLAITSGGDVGMGTTSPSTKLHVNGPLRHLTYTVATLPAAGTVGAGTRAAVTDANATTFNSVVAGGGANFVPVVSDGTNWRIG